MAIAVQGDFGKPRPALIIQSDNFNERATVSVLPVSSTLIDSPLFRVTVQPDDSNGLRKNSQVMVDKTMTVIRSKVGATSGSLSSETMLEIERCLAVFLGIAK